VCLSAAGGARRAPLTTTVRPSALRRRVQLLGAPGQRHGRHRRVDSPAGLVLPWRVAAPPRAVSPLHHPQTWFNGHLFGTGTSANGIAGRRRARCLRCRMTQLPRSRSLHGGSRGRREPHPRAVCHRRHARHVSACHPSAEPEPNPRASAPGTRSSTKAARSVKRTLSAGSAAFTRAASCRLSWHTRARRPFGPRRTLCRSGEAARRLVPDGLLRMR
jgi:hypothetical protein